MAAPSKSPVQAVLPGKSRQALPGSQDIGPKKLPGPVPAKNKNKLIIGLSLGIISVVFGILIFLTIKNKLTTPGAPSNDPRLQPTPTLIPRPTIADQPPGTPSEYANDPQILELEAAIKSLNAQLDSDGLVEPELAQPQLETNINFQ